MARLGIKIFYLRTREKGLSQQDVAGAIGVRQATLSHVEQGVSLPSCALLFELCRFYDVTPTFLIDDERDVTPLPTERWSNRNALVTAGMWVEARASALEDAGGGKVLCPLVAGESFYDEEAAQLRIATRVKAKREAALKKHRSERSRQDGALARALDAELEAHLQRRRKS